MPHLSNGILFIEPEYQNTSVQNPALQLLEFGRLRYLQCMSGGKEDGLFTSRLLAHCNAWVSLNMPPNRFQNYEKNFTRGRGAVTDIECSLSSNANLSIVTAAASVVQQWDARIYHQATGLYTTNCPISSHMFDVSWKEWSTGPAPWAVLP